MSLSAVVHGETKHCVTSEQIEALIVEVMTTLDDGNPWVNMDCGETAALYFGPEALTEDVFAEPPFAWNPTHELIVSVNRRTGFGAVRWDTQWVPVNRRPPRDPAVVWDPYVPSWYHPRHTVPVARIEAAVREFCEGAGERPECLRWVADGGDNARVALTAEEYRNLVGTAA
jgi:hypothetical protein